MSKPELHTELVVRSRKGFFVGDTRIRLLEAVARHGSITGAAKAVPMSYKAAWDAIDEMNNSAEEALVLRAVGGRNGGGASLTPYGVKMIALYRALETRHDQSVGQISATLDAAPEIDFSELQTLLERLALRSSVRNQFVGVISSLRQIAGDIEVELDIRIDAAFSICAVVSSSTAERLELAPGDRVAALVPATAIFLSTGPKLKAAARNRYRGTVLAVHRGPVNAEVTLELRSGKTLTTTVTRASADELELDEGVPAEALFKASSVVLQPI